MRAFWKPVLLPSPFCRISQKGPIINATYGQNKAVRVSASLMISRPLVGRTLYVHNGRYLNSFVIQPYHTNFGGRVGNFFFTKKFSPIHSGTSFNFEQRFNNKHYKSKFKPTKHLKANKKAFKTKSKFEKKR